MNVFRKGGGRRYLWIPRALLPRDEGGAETLEAPQAEPAPFSHNQANRILDEVWSTIESTWAPEEDFDEAPPPAASPESLPDPDNPQPKPEKE